MLTDVGIEALAEVTREWLKDARIFVGDGSQRAEVPLDHEPFTGIQPGSVELSATFDGDTANFEWTERGIIVGEQIVDIEESDGGRKIMGAIWAVTINLDVQALTS